MSIPIKTPTNTLDILIHTYDPIKVPSSRNLLDLLRSHSSSLKPFQCRTAPLRSSCSHSLHCPSSYFYIDGRGTLFGAD